MAGEDSCFSRDSPDAAHTITFDKRKSEPANKDKVDKKGVKDSNNHLKLPPRNKSPHVSLGYYSGKEFDHLDSELNRSYCSSVAD